MNAELVDRLVNTVLYEGYILYPYRPSVKNRHRWTFGGLYPRSYSEAQKGSDAWTMQTECLLEGNERTTLQVQVRFLHLMARLVGELGHPCCELADGQTPPCRIVESLRVGDRMLQTWQEAVERNVAITDLRLHSLTATPYQHDFSFPSSRHVEPVRDATGQIVAVLLREQQEISGTVEVSAAPAADGLFKLQVRVCNHTALDAAELSDRDAALLRSLVSANIVLAARAGALVSSIDPPENWRDFAACCRNVGLWPVLVGEAGERDTMLAAPIILYDYPQIAAESPGDLFDNTEIDEILTLRILTLTDEEKHAAAEVDERARALLQRTAAMQPQELIGLHGTVRGWRRVAEDSHD